MPLPLAGPPDLIKWTDVLTALATVAAALGTLATLIFFGLQLRRQSEALKAQRDASRDSLNGLRNQIAAQTTQAEHVAKQTELQTNQIAHLATQTRVQAQQAEVVAQTNKAILYQNVMREMQQLTLVLFSEPHLRPYFYEGAPLPRDPEVLAKVRILSEMFVDFIAFTLNTNILFDEENRESWSRYFVHVAKNSPAIQEFWRDHGIWYEKCVRDVLDPVAGHD